MHKVDAPNHSNNEFTDGDPGLGILATVLWSKWLNTIQRELVAVVEAFGITLDDANDAQLLEAILGLIGPHAGLSDNPHGVTKAQVGLANVLNLKAHGPFDLSLTAGTGTWTTRRAKAIFYQDPSGGWRMRFNINGTLSPAALNLDLRIAYVDFPNTTYGQAISAAIGSVPAFLTATAVRDGVGDRIAAYAGSNQSEWLFSGDVELAGEPTYYTL